MGGLEVTQERVEGRGGVRQRGELSAVTTGVAAGHAGKFGAGL